ncbi:MAG: methyltransferase [Planctomycetaceae bacterium]
MTNDALRPSESAPQAVMLELSYGYLRSRAIFVAAELGIADLLGEGPKNAAELAASTGTDADSLYRLLRMLASHGIFADDGTGKFQLTPLGEVLQSGAPGSVRDAVRMVDQQWWNSVGNLLHTVRTGIPAFDAEVGMSFYEYFSKHPEASARFDAGLASVSQWENKHIAAAYDFDRFRRIVDVGGSRGGLIAEVLQAHRSTTGVLYDRPEVVAEPTCLRTAGVMERCEVIGGSLLESVPLGADAYVLKNILPDWNDEQSISILRLCRDAMAEDGRVLTIDALVPPGNTEHVSKDLDVILMVVVRGRERTEDEVRELYRNAGLEVTKTVPTRSAYSVVEGKKA